MILVDTSAWVDHLRSADLGMRHLLEDGRVLVHPFVIGELACGTLADCRGLIELLGSMPAARVADTAGVLVFLDRRRLHGKGIGYVDLHLLASVALTPGARFRTRDRRWLGAAQAPGYAFEDAKPR